MTIHEHRDRLAGLTIDELVLSGVAMTLLVSVLAYLAPLPKAASRERGALARKDA